MSDPASKEAIRIWCMTHWIAVDTPERYPMLMPKRVAESPTQSADMSGFEHDGTWVVNYADVYCPLEPGNGVSCRDQWKVMLA